MILWMSLNLWADEEKRLHQCLTESLQELIAQNCVSSVHGELEITGLLHPILKRRRLVSVRNWSLDFEGSNFAGNTDPKPIGHPDIKFTRLDKDGNQYNYDIECKLVRIKRSGKSWDYCLHYVKDGVMRYESGKYAQYNPPMGTMLGYIQDGDFSSLLGLVNGVNIQQGLNQIQLNGKEVIGGVTKLSQKLKRDKITLHHLWADFR